MGSQYFLDGVACDLLPLACPSTSSPLPITQFPCFVVSKDTSHLNLFVPSPVRRNRPLTLHFPMSKRNSVRMANGSAATDGVVPSYLLTGKVALVTGSGRGMGRETASSSLVVAPTWLSTTP